MSPSDTSERHLFDSHCHIQDQRLVGLVDQVMADDQSPRWLAVNGLCDGKDWDRVHALFQQYPDRIIPNFGIHPWWLQDRSPDWLEQLRDRIASCAEAGVGECGVDRSVRCSTPLEEQLEVMAQHIRLAREFKRPTSIHMVRCNGPILDSLKKLGPVPEDSPLVLHSFCGPAEMISHFSALGPGVFFSLSGTLARINRDKAVKVAQQVPLSRLLVETDSPDGLLRLTSLGDEGQGDAEHSIAEGLSQVNLTDGSSEPAVSCCGGHVHMEGEGSREESRAAAGLNHPRNLTNVIQFIAQLSGRSVEEIVAASTANALRVFGRGRNKV